MYMSLIGSDPHSRHSSFQQEVDQNNLACVQFLSDSHHSPLISPGCYFRWCKPVIIQRMKWTQNTSKTEKILFLPENTRRRRTQLNPLSDKRGKFSSFQASWFTDAHMSFLEYQQRRDDICTIKHAFLHSDSYVNSVYFPLWYVKKGGLSFYPQDSVPGRLASQVVGTTDLFSLASVVINPLSYLGLYCTCFLAGFIFSLLSIKARHK